MPRPSLDAVSRGDDRASSWRAFDDEAENASFKPLTRAEAELFRQRHPALSPWRVIVAQLLLGALAAVVAGLVAGRVGAVSSLSPVVSTVSMMGWGFVKIAASVAMLVLASRIVPGVVWPVLLASMVLCL